MRIRMAQHHHLYRAMAIAVASCTWWVAASSGSGSGSISGGMSCDRANVFRGTTVVFTLSVAKEIELPPDEWEENGSWDYEWMDPGTETWVSGTTTRTFDTGPLEPGDPVMQARARYTYDIAWYDEDGVKQTSGPHRVGWETFSCSVGVVEVLFNTDPVALLRSTSVDVPITVLPPEKANLVTFAISGPDGDHWTAEVEGLASQSLQQSMRQAAASAAAEPSLKVHIANRISESEAGDWIDSAALRLSADLGDGARLFDKDVKFDKKLRHKIVQKTAEAIAELTEDLLPGTLMAEQIDEELASFPFPEEFGFPDGFASSLYSDKLDLGKNALNARTLELGFGSKWSPEQAAKLDQPVSEAFTFDWDVSLITVIGSREFKASTEDCDYKKWLKSAALLGFEYETLDVPVDSIAVTGSIVLSDRSASGWWEGRLLATFGLGHSYEEIDPPMNPTGYFQWGIGIIFRGEF